MLSALGTRYARALVDAVMAPQSGIAPGEAAAQLRSMEQVLAESADLRGAFQTPAIPTSRKRAVVARLADELKFARLIRNFLFVLLDHKRITKLSEIREAFELLVDEQLGFVRAEVTAAQALDDQQTRMLQDQLSRVTGRKVLIQTAVDPTLLGGVVARVGSTVYDGSIKGQIEQMRRKFAKESAEFKVGI